LSNPTEVLVQDTTIAARDGYALAATVYAPHAAPRGAVLINSATAVPRKIYRGFAMYLAEQGQTVLTYDYRGVGGSRPRSLRGFPVRMRDWAALDVAAAITHAQRRWPTQQTGARRASPRPTGARSCATWWLRRAQASTAALRRDFLFDRLDQQRQ